MCPGANPRLDCLVARISSIGTVVHLQCGLPGAPMDLVQLSTTYHISTGRVTYHNYEREIQRVARLPPTVERNISLFPFGNCADPTRPLGILKYLMSPWESRMTTMDITGADLLPIEDMCMWTNEKKLESGGSATRDPFHPDPVDRWFFPARFDLTSMCQCSSSSHRLRPTSKVSIDGMYTDKIHPAQSSRRRAVRASTSRATSNRFSSRNYRDCCSIQPPP